MQRHLIVLSEDSCIE